VKGPKSGLSKRKKVSRKWMERQGTHFGKKEKKNGHISFGKLRALAATRRKKRVRASTNKKGKLTWGGGFGKLETHPLQAWVDR